MLNAALHTSTPKPRIPTAAPVAEAPQAGAVMQRGIESPDVIEAPKVPAKVEVEEKKDGPTKGQIYTALAGVVGGGLVMGWGLFSFNWTLAAIGAVPWLAGAGALGYWIYQMMREQPEGA